MKISRKKKIGYCLLPLIMFLFWRAEPVRAAAAADAFDVVQVTKDSVDEYTSYRISGDGKKVAYRVSTEISKDGRIYSLYLTNADGSGSPELIDSTTALPSDNDRVVLSMLGIKDISYDGGKVLYSIYRYSSSGYDGKGYYFIYDASTGSKSEVGNICISDPLVPGDERCVVPSISNRYKTTALSGDGRYIFFIGNGTINCEVELDSATQVPDDYRWACPDGDTYTGRAALLRIMRVSADNPSNKDELVEWWSELGNSLERARLENMETDHTGSLIVLSKSGSEFYSFREGGEGEPTKLELESGSWWGGISPDGKWMTYSDSENNNIVVSSLDKSSKYSLELNNRFKLDKGSGAEAIPLDISEDASWLLVGGLEDQEEYRYQLATVRRNGSGFSPLPVYSYGYHDQDGFFYYDGNSLSNDGNSVAFIGRDKNKKLHLYVATRVGDSPTPKPSPSPTPSEAKNRTSGCTPCAEMVGEPVQTGTGEYFTDFAADINLGGPLPLFFSRRYASRFSLEGAVESSLGTNWMHNFDIRLRNIKKNSLDVVFAGGKIISFTKNKKKKSAWELKDAKEVLYQLRQDSSGYWLLDPSANLVYYFQANTLMKIMDRNENTLTLSYDSAGRLSQVSDGLGRTLAFTYDSSGRLTKVSDVTRTLTYGYKNGALASFTDALGNTTTYEYDSTGKYMTTTTLPLGNSHHTQTYDSEGRVTKQTDAYSNAYTFQYDTPKKGKTTITDPLGNTRTSTHAGEKVLTGLKDTMGKTSTLTYDSNDRPTSVTDRLGNTTTMSYNVNTGQPTSITDAQGNTGGLTYTPQDQTLTIGGGSATFTFNNLTKIEFPDSTSATFAYDGKGNLLSSTDQTGNTSSYTYNSQGLILALTNPEGGIITNTYNADGTRATSNDSETGTTTFTYDNLKRLIKETRPDNTSIQTAYNLNNRVISQTDEMGRVTSFTYDMNGNLTLRTDPDNNAIQNTYDSMDRLIQTEDRNGNTTTTTYDSLGKIASVIDPDGSSITYLHNENGWITGIKNAEGKTWAKAYNYGGVISSESTPLGNTTQFTTDKLGNITAVKDPLGNTYTSTYDSRERLTSTTDAIGKAISYTYDSKGNLTGVTQTGLGSSSYTRNKLGQMSSLTDQRGKASSFGYSTMGRLLSQADPLGNQWTYAYDTRGRPLTTTYPTGETKTVTYDTAGNIKQAAYSGGTTLSFTYDNLNRITSADDISFTYDKEGNITDTTDNNMSFGASYDIGDRLSTTTYNNNAFTVTYTYNSQDLLTKITDSITNTTMDFTYNDDGKLTNLARSNGITTTYTFDNGGRVTGIKDTPSTGSELSNQQYTLNAVGDIVTANQTLPLAPADLLQARTETYTFDDASQINVAGYTYDKRGRQTSSPTNTFTWNAAGQLSASGNAAFEYNGLGDLRLRTEGSATTHYYYNYAIGLKPIMAEKDESGGEFNRYFVWTPDGSLLYMIDAQNDNKVYFYHYDHLGSTLFLTNGAGTVTDSYAYTPYGVMLGHNGTNNQPFTYIGQHGVRQEGTEGLYHMRARYYDAVTTKFISRDPAWPRITNTKKLNPYQYVGESPVNNIDPQGSEEGDGLFWRAVAWYSGKGTVYDKIWGGDNERYYGQVSSKVVAEAQVEAMGEATKGKGLDTLKKDYLKQINEELEYLKCSKENPEREKLFARLLSEVTRAKTVADIQKAKKAFEDADWEREKQAAKDLAKGKAIDKIPVVGDVIEIGTQIQRKGEEVLGDK